MSDVAKNIANYLAAQGVGTVGTEIFYGQMPAESSLPADAPAVSVIESGGLDPEINSDRKHYNPTVQILVTGSPDEYADAQALADEVRGIMVDPLDLTVGSTVYYGSYQQGGNNFIGYDANNRPEWTLNFRLYRREAQ